MLFREFMETQKYSDNTKKSYMFYCRKLGRPITQETVNELCHEHNNNVARAAIRCYLIEFLDRKGIKIPKIKGRKKRLPKWLEMDEIRLLYELASEELKLVILLGFKSGLRISEILSLTPLSLKTNKIIGKGDKEDTIYINDATRRKLEKYIIENRIQPDQRILRYTRFNINTKLARLSKRVLGKRVSPHMFRHSCGIYLRRKGMDIMQIKKFLRHEKIETTAIYAEATDKEVGNKWKKIMG